MVDKKEATYYLLVGGWNTLFGQLSFGVLYYLTSTFLSDSIIIIISGILSITNAYLCYKFFVFKTKGNFLIEYFRFYLVYGVSILIGLVLFPVFKETLLPPLYTSLALEKYQYTIPYLAQFLLTGFTVIISYIGHKHFSFKQKDVSIIFKQQDSV